MANNELAIRFTEEMYATKADVSRELRMSLVDNIWSNILKYRSNYYRYLSLKSIEKNQLMVCYCQTFSNNLMVLDNKLVKQMGEYMKIDSTHGDLTYFDEMCLISSLRSLAAKRNIDISDVHLRSFIQGDLKDVSMDKAILRRYLKGLRFIKKNYNREIDIDYLADLYSAFTENPELTSFYREVEDSNPVNRVIIDRVYSSAPVALIDNLMNNLFSFLLTSTLSSTVKGIITYYFMNYIRPFPKDNEEIALLMLKSIIANGALEEFGAIIPLENILNINNESLNKVMVEVQKSNDLTYFIIFLMKHIQSSLDELNNIKANFTSDTIKKDFYREDVIEPAPTKKEEPVVTPIKEEPVTPQPVIKEEPIKVAEPVKEEPVIATPTKVKAELAFSYIPEELDEKAASRLEKHLLEMDPALKKGEAYFYARHCTMHMNYTIAQYKKALGCAYETARTSMEHLVELHYYQKNQIKNKFVYTPIKR